MVLIPEQFEYSLDLRLQSFEEVVCFLEVRLPFLGLLNVGKQPLKLGILAKLLVVKLCTERHCFLG